MTMSSEVTPGVPLSALPEAVSVAVLLVEDDDADALLVEEMLWEVPSTSVRLRRARSLAEAKPELAEVACVLLDLGLPDAVGLDGVRWLNTHVPQVAVVVLTGMADEHLGQQAVRAGAQDYLVKGQVDGRLLDRVIRYAVERRRTEDVHRRLREATIYAEENARLERGLLPFPVLSDPALAVATRYRPGAQQRLVGGDFYDVVQADDGWVHALVGDVCGHGPDEAALGVCLRVAWRTLVLAGSSIPEVRTVLGAVFEHERHQPGLFATMCVLSVSPDRRGGRLYLAGHPPPIVFSADAVRPLAAPVQPPLGIARGLGLDRESGWPAAEIEFDPSWSVWLYTDGLVEGRIGAGSARLGLEGLIELISRMRSGGSSPEPARDQETLLDSTIDRVRQLNGGDLEDDLAVLALTHLTESEHR
jgi:serine phosphatase RsbU (regulator of sigma subunit)